MITARQIDIDGTVNINIPIPIKVSLLIDLVNQAYEGSSITYWVAKARNAKRSELTIDGFTHNYCYSFEVREEYEQSWATVNVDTIKKGIIKILQGNTEINTTLQSMILRSVTIDGQDEIDDEALDYIVQVGLFGETIYA